MGNDYYTGNEHWVDGIAYGKEHELGPNEYHYRQSGEIFGYYVVTRQYYDRYRLPVMHTETNFPSKGGTPDEAVEWLQKELTNVQCLWHDGVPIVGFTWYGLVDLVGWDELLLNGNTKPVPAGLCTLEREIRPAGKRYQALIDGWRWKLQGAQTGTVEAARMPADAVERGKRMARQIKDFPQATFKGNRCHALP